MSTDEVAHQQPTGGHTAPWSPDPVTLDRLLRVLRARTGFDLAGYRLDGLSRRAASRAQRLGEPDLEGYLLRVAGDDQEARVLQEHLLVQVSGWFRDPHVWEVLRTAALPGLARGDGGGPVRAWVAGCGDGQEAFSLAACLAEATTGGTGHGGGTRGWSVLATDVDTRALHVLAGARYPRSPLPAPALDVLAPHLAEDGSDWVVSEGLRAGVSWLRHDVREPPPVDGGPFDLVVCRNLLMYLDDAVQLRVVDDLVSAVRPGGVLVLGQAELPLGRRDALVPVDLAARVYRSIAQPLDGVPR